MSFSVSLTESAKGDVRCILRWIEERSPAGAQAWHRRWLEALTIIAESAESCTVALESEDHPESIRQIIFKTRSGRPYRALFIVRESDVFVLHVRGPGQDLLAHWMRAYRPASM